MQKFLEFCLIITTQFIQESGFIVDQLKGCFLCCPIEAMLVRVPPNYGSKNTLIYLVDSKGQRPFGSDDFLSLFREKLSGCLETRDNWIRVPVGGPRSTCL